MGFENVSLRQRLFQVNNIWLSIKENNKQFYVFLYFVCEWRPSNDVNLLNLRRLERNSAIKN